MRHLIWAFAERLVSRLASAALMFLLAAFVDPATVGLYSWMILSLTLVQAVLDLPVRQIAVEAVGSPDGLGLLRRIRTGAVVTGLATMSVTLAALLAWSAATADAHAAAAWLLTPLVLVPLCTASSMLPTAQLQRLGEWRLLAGVQARSSLGALAVSLPILLATGSLLGVALQPLLAEAGYAWGAHRAAARRAASPSATGTDVRTLRREWHAAVGYSFLGWAQGQADRVVIGSAGGTAALGSFTIATTLGRTGGEAVTNAGTNVLRTRTAAVATDRRRLTAAVDHLAQRVLLANVAVVLLIALAAATVLPALLRSSWLPALHIAPVVAVSVLPASVSWCLSIALVAAKRTRRALPIKVLGVLLALPIGLSALMSLELAAWLIVARELVMLALTALVAGAVAPRRTLLLCAVMTPAAAAVVICLQATGLL